jgi:hypothetical protein
MLTAIPVSNARLANAWKRALSQVKTALPMRIAPVRNAIKLSAFVVRRDIVVRRTRLAADMRAMRTQKCASQTAASKMWMTMQRVRASVTSIAILDGVTTIWQTAEGGATRARTVLLDIVMLAARSAAPREAAATQTMTVTEHDA